MNWWQWTLTLWLGFNAALVGALVWARRDRHPRPATLRTHRFFEQYED